MTTSTRGPDEHTQPIRGPGELVQAIPYLIGYHPAESLVLVGLRRARLVVTIRLDLADPDANSCEPDGLLDHTIRRAVDGGATEFVALIYPGAPDRPELPDGVVRLVPGSRRGRGIDVAVRSLPGVDVVHAVATALVRCDGVLLDAMLVRGGRCWSYLSSGPDDGWDLAIAPSPFVAEATVAGAAPLRDREAVAASLDPCSDDERAGLDRVLEDAVAAWRSAARDGGRARHERAARRAVLAAAKACDRPGWVPPGDAELARLAVALTDIETRDEVWLAIESRRLDARALMLELARRCPSPYDAAPLFLYGWACWRAGNGMLAGVAARRAVASDPSCSAAEMLLGAVDHGVDPHRVAQLRRPRTRR